MRDSKASPDVQRRAVLVEHPRDLTLVGQELGRELVLERAVDRKLDAQVGADAARARRHDDHAVAQEDRLVDVVRDEEDRRLPVLADQQHELLHLLAGLRVERAERLVHQQHRRLVGERAGDRHALLHAARQLARIRVRKSAAHQLEQRRERVPSAARSRLGRS
jgi:hypothetical protein